MKTTGRQSWKAIGLALFLIVAPLVLILMIYLPMKIAQWPVVQKKLAALEKAGIRIGTLTISPKGRVRALNIRMGNPLACQMVQLNLDLSLLQLLQGKIAFKSAEGYAIQINGPQLDLFVQQLKQNKELEQTVSLPRRFRFQGQKLKWVAETISESFTVQKFSLSVRQRAVISGKMFAYGAKFENLPLLQFVVFNYEGTANTFKLSQVETKWDQVRIRGNMNRSVSGELTGTVEFEKVDLKRLAGNRLDTGQALEGIVSGQSDFTMKWNKTRTFEASGSMLVRRFRIRNFPAQQDPLIQNYLPDLVNIRFQDMHIPRWRIKNKTLYLDSLEAVGNQLSMGGYARILYLGKGFPTEIERLNGRVYMNLTGHLSEPYFGSLNPLVKNGFYRDSSGTPSFKFQVQGNFQQQTIKTEKMISVVVKSISSRISHKMQKLFR